MSAPEIRPATEADLPSVHLGDAADVITGSGQTLPGRVDYIAALVGSTFRVTVPGQFVGSTDASFDMLFTK